jgi:hypothetical protein
LAEGRKDLGSRGADYPFQSLAEMYGLDVSYVTYKDKPSLRNWGLYEKDGTRQFVFRNERTSGRNIRQPRLICRRKYSKELCPLRTHAMDKQIAIVRHPASAAQRYLARPSLSVYGRHDKEKAR